ncbi:MAG: hypothetical protein AAF936_09640 [Pseudomonadota bacterium]
MILAISFSLMAGAAQAHPGSAILTVGGEDERQAMTNGVTFEEIGGVHLYRGRAALAGAEPAPGTELDAAKECGDTIIYKGVWRSFRSLRTQGFYSGRSPRSRRYTQGFYSGR